MIDPSIPMEERMTIWSGVDELEPQFHFEPTTWPSRWASS